MQIIIMLRTTSEARKLRAPTASGHQTVAHYLIRNPRPHRGRVMGAYHVPDRRKSRAPLPTVRFFASGRWCWWNRSAAQKGQMGNDRAGNDGT